MISFPNGDVDSSVSKVLSSNIQPLDLQDKILIDAVNKRALRALFEKIREECTNKNEELCITSIIYIYDNVYFATAPSDVNIIYTE